MVPDPPSPARGPVPTYGWRVALLTSSSDVVHLLAEALRARGHEVVAVVLPTGPDGLRPQNALAWSLIHHAVQAAPPSADVLIASRRDRLAPLLEAVKPDFLLSFFFPWRIPSEALAVPPLGAVNLHPSLLPRYRGPNPLGWTLRNDEPEMGLSLHRMDARFDTGPLLAQGRRPITDADTVELLFEKLMSMAWELLPEMFTRVAWGDAGEPQQDAQATQAGHFEPSYRELDWSLPARELHLRTRACRVASWRGGRPSFASAQLAGRRVHVLSTRLTDSGGTTSAAPGTVLAREGETFLVQCGDAPLWVLQTEPWQA
jgi:methionyl-tRNA formyltransferase